MFDFSWRGTTHTTARSSSFRVWRHPSSARKRRAFLFAPSCCWFHQTSSKVSAIRGTFVPIGRSISCKRFCRAIQIRRVCENFPSRARTPPAESRSMKSTSNKRFGRVDLTLSRFRAEAPGIRSNYLRRLLTLSGCMEPGLPMYCSARLTLEYWKCFRRWWQPKPIGHYVRSCATGIRA